MKRHHVVILVVVLLVLVQLPYIWLLWFQPTPAPPYGKTTQQLSAGIDWVNPEPARFRWFLFNDSSGQPIRTGLKSGDNLTLWLRISEFNRTAFNITRIRNIQLWFFNIWSPNSTQWGGLWKINIYLQGQFDRSQMLGVPNAGTGTQLILNWDDSRVQKAIGEVLRFDFDFESIVQVDAMLVISSIEILVIVE
jgi:hypothetical protein